MTKFRSRAFGRVIKLHADPRMNPRRHFLKSTLNTAASLIAGQLLVTTGLLRKAQAVTGLPVHDLHASLKNDGSLVLVPSDQQATSYATSFNRRTQKMPQVRVVAATAQAVAIAIQWARKNNVPFATRGGGHSYEGYSQSEGLVIDVRLLDKMTFDPKTQTATFGAGCSLGSVYVFLSKYNMAIPAGSCPPVGIAGHTLGGGYGFLARKFGLACDNVESYEFVTPDGKLINVSAEENQDLNWALRGGGNGNFGIVTRFKFRVHEVTTVNVFKMKWMLTPQKAADVVERWQAWAPQSPDETTSIMKISNGQHGLVSLTSIGLTLADQLKLKSQLSDWTTNTMPALSDCKTMSFIDSVKHFGGDFGYESVYMKAKSDYATAPVARQGLLDLMNALAETPVPINAICDSYGGAIGRVKDHETAFAHREKALFSIQYYTQWGSPADSSRHLDAMKSVYASMRPFVSGGAYVNYCDLDLQDPQRAYWGDNLERLVQIKAQVDPLNLFRHAQSLPTTLG